MSDNPALDTGVKNRGFSLMAYQAREGKADQSYWDRVGVDWSNSDGGFTVQFHAMPLDGRIVGTLQSSAVSFNIQQAANKPRDRPRRQDENDPS